MRPQPLIVVKDIAASSRFYVNPGPRHREIWLKDLDGYTVVLCSPDGEAG